MGPDGRPYPPFHDAQMIVDGDAARVLGELARERWKRASDHAPTPPRPEAGGDPWPPELEPDLRDVEIGIARTFPAHAGHPEIREVETLHVDAIAAARRFIYLENQYLTAHVIVQALARRLAEEDGPEVIVILPQKTSGWLEQHTMDVLRARRLWELQAADHHGRLRIYGVQRAEDPPTFVTIHAKVCVIDDAFARVGSANLSNRSMGLDAECDLAVEARDRVDHAEAITAFRRGLVAEHLHVTVDRVAASEARHASLIQAIEALRTPTLGLRPLEWRVSDEVDGWVPDTELLDPEEPVAPEALLEHVVGSENKVPAVRSLLGVGLAVALLLALAAVWRWTPFGEHLSVEGVTEMGRTVAEHPLSPVLVLLGYLAAGLLVVPVTVLILATVLVFGPWLGSVYALTGAELSALGAFGIGHLLGRDAVTRLAGSRAAQLRRRMTESGVFMVVTFRLLPVAPFTVVNVVAGASAIRLRDFAIGNLLGLLPGVIAMALVADGVVAMLRDPSVATIGVAALSIVLVAVAWKVIQSRLGGRSTGRGG